MLKISETPLKVAESVAAEFRNVCEENISKKGNINIAISGGNTPKLLFEVLTKDYKNKIDWSKTNFYWADERCVSTDSNESNFGMTHNFLFNKINIPESNIHRIYGENEPASEAVRYSEELRKNIFLSNDLPKFDLILLGMGDDGHTASIFPDQMEIMNSDNVCAVAVQPESRQKRITLTGNVINNADKIYFLVTGKNKAEVISEILDQKNNYLKYPAAHIQSNYNYPFWFLDKEAASLLK